MDKTRMKKGFSIVELIFVIAILGIIASVAVSKLMNSRTSAVITTVKQDVDTITTSIQSYYMLNNKIDKISDCVTLNSDKWNITDKKVEYNINSIPCITIDVQDNKINLNINQASSELCKKIYDAGIKNSSYDLL